MNYSEMKAKELAQAIISESDTTESAAQIVADVVTHLVYEARKKAAARSSDQSAAAVFREALTKWKAIVNAVKAQNPEHLITVNLFGLTVAGAHVPTFEALVQARVFLGYVFTAEEQSIIDSVKDARIRAVTQQQTRILIDRVLTGRATGIDLHLFLRNLSTLSYPN